MALSLERRLGEVQRGYLLLDILRPYDAPRATHYPATYGQKKRGAGLGLERGHCRCPTVVLHPVIVFANHEQSMWASGGEQRGFNPLRYCCVSRSRSSLVEGLRVGEKVVSLIAKGRVLSMVIG
jgi:hypothetical protein